MKLSNFLHKKRFFSKETVKKDAFEQKNICVTLEELLQESPISNYKNNFTNYSSSITGLKKSSLRGRGMDFMESRPYVFQDEIRHIDWKISAKRSNLFTKIFTEAKQPVLGYCRTGMRAASLWALSHGSSLGLAKVLKIGRAHV